jgi:hypothetical protein
MNFQKINNITGWAVFTIATFAYILTVEQTASFWDCGEFIAVSYKLMVPHPPGAPLFLLIGRMFSFLSFGDLESVAYWINISSVLSSGFTILFLFWSITMLGRKLMKITPGSEPEQWQTLALMGAGAVGALAYTFSDSFWFSAVEAEVYAMSSFFTAIVFWAILKWDLIEDESRANRWLILLAYIVGLSIGVHLLNLVTLPALGLIYYFKKYKVTTWGLIACLAISGALVLFINDFIIPGLPTIAGKFELTFVNDFRLPFGSGTLFFSILFIGALVYGILYSIKIQHELLNTALLAFTFILIGYASYAIIPIRSNHNPPIDENNPEDIMSFVSYLKREQYGSRPLLYGQYFTARPTGTTSGSVIYSKGKTKYEPTDRRISYTYDKADKTLLPRMYSNSPAHVEKYREVTGLREGEKPSFRDNMVFMIRHQIGHMYMRYFMWNFSGRESDIQNADWLAPWDAFEEVPELIANNKARNNFFMIPLILGIIGLFYQYAKDAKNFTVVMMLFFMTGLALILYLNSPPVEPRERDYIYVGSFYAFAIWIGFAVIALAEVLRKVISQPRAAVVAATLIALSAPILMAQQGWDDHDRSNRYFSVDSAKNFLVSTAPNAIFFTGGDNDTFPLWYVQDVEDFRTDVRVVVLSYFNTDWYIEQMTRQVYASAPFPFSLTMEHYRQGGPNDVLPYEDLGVKELDVHQYLDLIRRKHPSLRVYQDYNVVPSRNFIIKVDREAVLKSGIIPAGMDSLVTDRMTFSLKRGASSLEKKDLMILDILATNNWERPIYLNNTSMAQINIDLEKYSIQEGQAYRILPIANPHPRKDFVNTDVMYDNMVNKFFYRELDNPKVNHNEDYRNFVLNHRSSFNNLAYALIDKGQEQKAMEVVLFSLEKMPDAAIPYDYTNVRTVELLFRLGDPEKAVEMAAVMGTRADEMLDYMLRKNSDMGREMQINLAILAELQRSLYAYGEEDLAKRFEDAYLLYANRLGLLDRMMR